MNLYDTLQLMINAVERASDICPENEAMALYEAVRDYHTMRDYKLDEAEQAEIERRLEGAMELIKLRNTIADVLEAIYIHKVLS